MLRADGLLTVFIGSEIFERLRSSKYTPSVSRSLDSSLKEGAGRERPVPGSLSEGAGSPQGLTEGVSFDGCFGPMVLSVSFFGSEIFERLRSSKYTPSVSHSLDSSLREGAGRERPVPGSLSEGAGSPQGLTEGVSSDGCSMPMVFQPAHINSEIYEFLRSSKYTPSVSRSLDSSLREGAGNGLVPFIGVLAETEGYGRFSSPLRKAGSIHRPYEGRVPFYQKNTHPLSRIG